MTLIDAYQKFIEWRGLKRNPRTINGDITHLAQFCLFMRDPYVFVEKITLDECLQWLGIFKVLGFDNNTIIKKALAIRQLFEFLMARDVKVLNPLLIPLPERSFRFPRVADEEGYRKILAVIPQIHERRKGFMLYAHIRNEAVIKLLWESGARNSEILSLEMDDLNLEKMSARIKTKKSRGTIPFREIFWREEASEALKKWLAEREKLTREIELENPQAIFFGIKGGHKNCPYKGRQLQGNWLSEILRKYSNKAGLAVPLNPHSMRHHFGRDLAEKDTEVYGIATLLGHANVASSYIYTMLFGKKREDLYRKKMGGNGAPNGGGNGINFFKNANGKASTNYPLASVKGKGYDDSNVKTETREEQKDSGIKGQQP